jgi:hypothetical protein
MNEKFDEPLTGHFPHIILHRVSQSEFKCVRMVHCPIVSALGSRLIGSRNLVFRPLT